MTMQTILRPIDGSTYDLSISTSSARTPALTRDDVRIHCTVDSYVKIGGSDVVASASDYDIFVPADISYDFSTGGGKYIAVLGTDAGTAYINQWTNRAL